MTLHVTSDQPAGCLVAGMVELHEQLRVICMHRFDEPVQLRYHMGISDAQLVGSSDSGLVIYSCYLGNDKARAASGSVGIILYHPCSGFTGRLSQRTSHRCHYDPVSDLKSPDPAGLEQFCVSHLSSFFSNV